LRWRQTAVYTTLVGALALAGVMAYGVWRGELAPPWQPSDFKAAPSPSPTPLLIPCPSSADAVYPAPTAVSVRVLNGAGQAGMAAAAADVLAAHGFPAPTAGNAARYQGLVKLVTGPLGVDAAYTVLQFSPEGTVILLEQREDASVDMVLGTLYEGLRSDDEIVYDPAAAISPAEECRPVEDLLVELPAPLPSPLEDAATSEAAAFRR
jgi:hypothetical protein